MNDSATPCCPNEHISVAVKLYHIYNTLLLCFQPNLKPFIITFTMSCMMFWTCCIINMIQYTLWLWLEWEACVNCKLVRWIPTKCDMNNKKWQNKWQYKTYKIRQIIILKCNITVVCPYYISGKWQNTTEKF